MKETVSKSTFIHRFADIGRKDQFSYAAREALFDYFEELEDAAGEEMEFDPIAICCDWAEYTSAFEAATEYSWEPAGQGQGEDPDEYAERREGAALEWLQGQTQVLSAGDGVVVQDF